LVDELVALVDQNVSILSLDTALLCEYLLHRLVMLMLSQLLLPVLILTAKGFLRNFIGVEGIHQRVVEFKPALAFTILDERVVMARVGGAVVDDYPCQLVVVVARADFTV